MNKIAEIFDMLLDPFDDKESKSGFGEDFGKYRKLTILSYIFPILFFLPAVKDKYSPFCKFHANQSFLWLITCIVVNVIGRIIKLVPLVGGLASWVVSLALVLVTAMLAYGEYTGKAIKLPIIGDMLKLF